MLDRYNQVFFDVFGVSEGDLGPDFAFGTVEGWDSLGHMEFVAALEDAFDIMLDPDEITHFGSYEHGKEILASHGIKL